MIVLTTAPFLYGQIPVFVDVNVFTGQEILVSLSDVMLTTWGVHFFCHFCFLCYTDHAIRTTLHKNRQHFDIEALSPSLPIMRTTLLDSDSQSLIPKLQTPNPKS